VRALAKLLLWDHIPSVEAAPGAEVAFLITDRTDAGQGVNVSVEFSVFGDLLVCLIFCAAYRSYVLNFY